MANHFFHTDPWIIFTPRYIYLVVRQELLHLGGFLYKTLYLITPYLQAGKDTHSRHFNQEV